MMKKRFLSRILLLFVLAATVGFAQQQKIRIASISVRGNETASDRIVKLSFGVSEGEEITSTDIQEGIRKLYNLKLFSDINVVASKETQAGLHIVIQLSEYPRIDEVLFEGNEKYKDSKLREEISLIRGQVFAPHGINKAKRAIMDKYADAGFFSAEVDVTAVPSETKDGRVDITFIVD